MYPSTSLFIAFGQLAIVILVLFSYPLQVHPCRNCLDKVFHPGHVQHEVKKPATQSGDGDDEDDGEEDDHMHAEMSTFKHTVLTTAIIALGFAIAYFVDDLRLGEFGASLLGLVIAEQGRSVVVRGVNRVHDHLLHSAWPILLEGERILCLLFWWY
jgi:Transmembrane amino acid transporter protein.